LLVLLLAACGARAPKTDTAHGKDPGAQPAVETGPGDAGQPGAGGTGNADGSVAQPAPRESLELLLRQFGSAHVNSRARFVHQIRIRIEDFDDPLLEIVGANPPEPEDILLPAVEIVGWLRLSRGENALERLVGDGMPAVRAAAVSALHRFGYWTRKRLAAQLHDTEPEVLCALLSVSTLLDDAPVAEIVALLAHPDPKVRAAVVDALPQHADPQVLSALGTFATTGDNGVRIDAIKLLGRLDATPARDTCLAQCLQTPEWSIRQACLLALANGDSKLEAAASVWRRIDAPDSSVTEQVAALAVLESRATVDVPRLLRLPASLHPVPRLQAARCLVRAGALEAVPMLIDLLSTQQGLLVDDEDQNCARDGARRVLSELAEEDLGTEPEAWRRWQRRLTRLPAQELKTAPRLVW